MRNKGHILLLLVAVVLLAAVCQGCGAKSAVSRADLKKVNAYIETQGAEKMDKKDAEDVSRDIWRNRESGEVKATWEMIVDFVDNAKSETPQELGVCGRI